jgi:hypothetical protein
MVVVALVMYGDGLHHDVQVSIIIIIIHPSLIPLTRSTFSL